MLKALAPGLLLLGSAAGAAPLLGPQQITVLVVRVDDDRATYSDLKFLSAVQSKLKDFATVMNEYSSGQVSFTFDIRGPYLVSSTLCDNTDPSVGITQHNLISAAVLAADSTVKWSAVRQTMLFARYYGSNCNLKSSGYSRQIWPIATAEGSPETTMTFLGDVDESEPDSETLVHEYSHTQGATHLDVILCKLAGVRIPIDHHPNPFHRTVCTPGPPYGMDHEPLGFMVSRHHFAIPRKLFWGWTGAWPPVTSSGTYFITPTEGTQNGRKQLRIPMRGRSAQYTQYILEYRDGSGLDIGQTRGVYLYADRSIPTKNMFDLIEPQPFLDTTQFTARPLQLFQPYTDPVVGVTINVRNLAAEATVDVRLF